MRKNNLYWIIAILALLVAVAAIWSFASKPKPQGPAASGSGASQSGQMDHNQMDHSQMGGQSSSAAEDPDLRAYLEEQDAIMADMMRGMEEIEHSGSAAADFLSGMIPHHEAAVSMAQSYLDHGGDHAVLAPMARDIITAQRQEIQQMRAMLDDFDARGLRDEAQESAYLEAYDSMMQSHEMGHAAAQSLDQAFAQGMLLHHQMAVDMSSAILEHTDNEDVKQLAQTIVDAQLSEIDQMQSVLDGLQME